MSQTVRDILVVASCAGLFALWALVDEWWHR